MGPELDIRSKSEGVMDNKFQEPTESSSSFDDDASGCESGSAFSDDDFVSDFRDYIASGRVGEGCMPRKKQLTTHWMTFIKPIRWRCKWVELKMRQLNKLEHKYTRELEKYNQNTLQQVEGGEPDLCSREVSFSGGRRRDKIFTRKRRKRIEDTEDIETYMAKHNLFSFYFPDKKKNPAEEYGNKGIIFDNEFGLDEESLFLKAKDADEILEQVLPKIDTLMGRVSKLKSTLDKVMSDIPVKLSAADERSSLVPCNGLATLSRDPASYLKNSDRMAVGSSPNASRLISKCNMGDVHLPGRESVELEDDVLIYNDRILDGMNGFEDFNVQPAERPQRAAKTCQGTTASCVFEEPEMHTDEERAPKLRSIAQLTDSTTRKSQRGHKPRRFFQV